MPYLKEDTYSAFNPNNCYGNADTPVTIISDRGGTLIVETRDGLRIPLLPKDLIDEPSTKPSAAGNAKKEAPVAPKAAAAVRRQVRTKSPPGNHTLGEIRQGGLFGD